MNWDILIKAFGAVAGALFSIYQIRNMLPRQRAHLRADLEILKLMDKADPGFNLVREHINKQLRAIYGANQQGSAWSVGRIGSLIIGIAWAAGFSYWSFYSSQHHVNWWSIVTGLFALLGAFFVIGILVENKPGSKS